MRIILLSLAAIGSAAIGGPALAQTLSIGGAQRGGAHVPRTVFPGDSLRRHGGFRHDGMHRAPRGPRGRPGRGGPAFLPLVLGGYGEPAPSHGDGFFAGGGEVRMEGGRPVYEYDRSYPYEWPSAAVPMGVAPEDRPYGAEPRCTVEQGVRVCRR